MIRKLILHFIFLILCLTILPAQEVITGLQSNYIEQNLKKSTASQKALTADSELPFFDDFSGKTSYPDILRWTDNNVFINNSYTEDQITKGVATFDAIDNAGMLYETASSTGFMADKLTSVPINLNYSSSENIWFSFFYQAGGLGDKPELNDSLTLQFLDPTENKWYSIWNSEGQIPSGFKPVIFRIENARFLKAGFRFRFINYATLSPNLIDPSIVGNCDIWNVDYIVLDRNRNEADTVFADVAFRKPVRSILNTYEAMPWKQFLQAELKEMGPSITLSYRNNDLIARNVTRSYDVWDVYKNIEVHSYLAGAVSIDPLTNRDDQAAFIYTFKSNNPDSALFRITSTLKTDVFDPKRNDTLIYYQVFKNYFAYDDGTSEGGYGINGLGSRNAMLAYRFKSYIPDTLRAVRICFNDSYLDANQRAFDLMVWNDNNELPGDVIYSVEELIVEKSDVVNGFFTYKLPEGIRIEGTFYVGWKQRSETFMNAGFDVNTPHGGKQLYWLNGDWRTSQVSGSVMIRPVVGDPLRTTSIDDIFKSDRNLISVWPNPASDYINITSEQLQLSDQHTVTISDFSGRRIMNIKYSESINVSSLHEGIYFITISLKNRPVGYTRLIKTR